MTQSMGALNLAPGVPLPNADILYQMIMTNLFKSSSSVDGSYIVDFLFGEPKERDPHIPNINVLDYPTFRKLIKIAKIRHLNETLGILDKKFLKRSKNVSDKLSGKRMFPDVAKANKTRRTYEPETDQLLSERQSYMYARKFMSLMQQSVYQTQYNLKKTKFYRKKFEPDLNYRFALLYGMILESKDKLDSLINVMTSLYYKPRKQGKPHAFIYFLSIYEKVLATTTDINYLVHHLMELSHGIRKAVQKISGQRDNKKRPEVRRRN